MQASTVVVCTLLAAHVKDESLVDLTASSSLISYWTFLLVRAIARDVNDADSEFEYF